MLLFFQTYPFIPAFLMGMIPALIWLWFWLKEDIHPEPAKMITLSFIGGIIAVLVVLPIQRLAYTYVKDFETLSFFIYATIEELTKFIIVYFIALRKKIITDEPVDDIIYLIVCALGFVNFENALFLIEPLRSGNIIETIVTGNLRFMGASLVHIISSASIGIFMGWAFYRGTFRKRIYLFLGIVCAIILHSAFNLIIINQSESHIFYILGGVWAVIIVVMLLIEKIKHITRRSTIDAIIKNNKTVIND